MLYEVVRGIGKRVCFIHIGVIAPGTLIPMRGAVVFRFHIVRRRHGIATLPAIMGMHGQVVRLVHVVVFRNGMTARHARLYVLRSGNRDARAAVAFRYGISAPRTSLGVLRAGDGSVGKRVIYCIGIPANRTRPGVGCSRSNKICEGVK